VTEGRREREEEEERRKRSREAEGKLSRKAEDGVGEERRRCSKRGGQGSKEGRRKEE
jgi:hypothetical protein